MPTYDYECEACGHTFERFQEMTAPKLKTCPSCGKRKLIRLVGTGLGVIFRGSGFYETDYKRAAARTGAKRDASDGGSGGGSDAGAGGGAAPAPAAGKKSGEAKGGQDAKASGTSS